MEVIRGAYNLQKRHHGCVLTIGNFDGVHLGHLSLVDRLKVLAREYQLPSVVMTFEPHPLEFFGVDIKPRLTLLRGKVQVLSDHGVDRVLVMRFNKHLASMSAEDFIEQILVNKLGVKHVLVGDDFRFGAKRGGDIALLMRLGNQFGFKAEPMPTFIKSSQRVSSTLVREALDAGNMCLAHDLLGRFYSMSGHVAHGNQRGRIIGFPTANIFLQHKLVPIHGVFCVKVHGLGDEPVLGVANVGNRPTVDGTTTLLEVHLFDFDRDIYGEHVTVAFEHKLRDEEKYDSFELLKVQILKDAQNARAYFANSAASAC